jgi:glycosyltransferase involved in cell wall biosynthesis
MFWTALSRLGYRVELASRFRSWDGAGDARRQERLRLVGERLVERLVRRWLRTDAGAAPKAWFTYHVYHKAPDWLGPAVSRTLDIPYVVAEPSHATRQAHGQWALGHRASENAILAADALLVVNRNDLEALSRMAIAPQRLHRLLPFLDVDSFQRPARNTHKNELATHWQLDSQPPWLLAVGMLRPGDKQSSYVLLAEALAALTDLKWQLVVVGDGSARRAVRECLETRIPGRYRLVGKASPGQLRDWLWHSDLFVWPAVNEAYGIALLEAQAAGLAVVAGNVGGVSEIVCHRVTGLLSPVGDSATFADQVRQLLLNPTQRARLGVNAAARARSAHDTHTATRTLGAILAAIGVRPISPEETNDIASDAPSWANRLE